MLVSGRGYGGLAQGSLYVWYSTYMLASALVFTGVMIYKYVRTNIKIIKEQILISLSGFFLAVILVSLSDLIPILQGKSSYPLTTVSFSIFSLFVLYTVFRYRLFLVSPTTFSRTEDRGVLSMQREEAERRFRDYVKKGVPSIAFITEDPESFKRRNEIGDTPVFQITDKTGKDRLNPAKKEHREMMQFILMSFSEKAENSVVLLDMEGGKDFIPSDEYRNIVEDFRNMVNSRDMVLILVG